MYEQLSGLKVGYAMCGSFCTFAKSFDAAKKLSELGCELFPIMSFNAATISSRFGSSDENTAKLESICGKKIISSIEAAEPIGPKKLLDILVVSPCTGNTLAKLASGITDTPVTMAVKSHIRNGRPVILAIATNDALGAAAKNIGAVQNYRSFYFVPYGQDDFEHKPNSMISHFELVPDTIVSALSGIQPQPIIVPF